MKRKICVVTGTRAEYGLLYWLMKEIQDDPDLSLQVVATGMHLAPEFGSTYRQIEADGFRIEEKVEMLLSSDTPVGITKSIGLGVIGFADALARLQPHVLVLLGDRFETFAAAQAAMVARIPIAHIHGGEITEGVIDEAMRHAITKMAHLHFTAAESYRRRVIQLGERPEKVFNCGAPGLDHIERLPLLDKASLERELDFQLGERFFLVTYHPVTLADVGPEGAIDALLCALDRFPDVKLLFTGANADAAGRLINRKIGEYVAARHLRAKFITSLGQLLYLSALSNATLVVGNSSSGLLEAPALRKPTVNLGDRQKGRLRAGSVIDCEEKEAAIVAAIRQGLSPEFATRLQRMNPPYGGSGASLQIKQHLKSVDLDHILMKGFHDIDFEVQDELAR
jgi:UDP-hydrolysing UDP-N-acetyl-D-glucosamine 2-epimerase